MERDRARSNYQALSGYLDETLIVLEHDGAAAYCVAKAVVPWEKDSNTRLVSILAGFMGLILSVVMVIFYEWWRNPQKDEFVE